MTTGSIGCPLGWFILIPFLAIWSTFVHVGAGVDTAKKISVTYPRNDVCIDSIGPSQSRIRIVNGHSKIIFTTH